MVFFFNSDLPCKIQVLALSLVLLMISAKPLYSNGGPVAWTGTSPIGAIGLIQNQDAVLEEEKLFIDILDYNRYSVHAEYKINNLGREQRLNFGVPIRWSEVEIGAALDKGIPTYEMFDALEGLESISRTIQVKVNGRKVSCRPKAVLPENNATLSTEFDKDIRAWCVSEIVLENGSNTIALDYISDLEFEDMLYTKSAFTRFSVRKLVYWLYPAGFWQGTVAHVDVRISLGPYEGFVGNSVPESFVVQGDTMTWEGRNIDFKKTDKIAINLNAKILSANERASWNSKDHYVSFKDTFSVSASSRMPSSGSISYEPKNVLDGDTSTAWCSDKQSSEKPVYLQFEAHKPESSKFFNQACGLEGLMITNGYMKNQSVYMANNRIRKISVETCDGSRKEIFNIPEGSDYRLAARVIENEMPEDEFKKFITEYEKARGNNYTHPDYSEKMPQKILEFIRDLKCFRIEILEVEEGSDNDTCVSEFSLVINCG